MGITKQIKDYEKKTLHMARIVYNGLSWCELGNQTDIDLKEPAKKGYQRLGVNHTSIDLNGKSGALRLNLDKPLPAKLLGVFDVVTNYGTLEHVNNQYQAFKNVHDACKVGGIMIHALVLENNWFNHCRYYYNEYMMLKFSLLCKYELVDIQRLLDGYFTFPKNLLMITYKKTNNEFITKEQFKQLGIIDSGNLNNTGNYNNKIYKLFKLIKRKWNQKI